jgi:3-hydroxy-9,10-secoandrosta-1,3,5(10)-triene-9,17-dione monooxygenase reductase component
MAADEKLNAEKLNAVYDTMRAGLFIVTSAWRKRLAGCTCLWVTRVSFNPQLVAIYLSPARHTCETIERSKRFVLHSLADDSLELARRFGLLSGRETDKFSGVAWTPGGGGVPVLAQAAAVLECRLAGVEPQGDHHLLLGEVLRGAVQRELPHLIYDPHTFYAVGTPQAEASLGSSGGA